MLSAYTIFLVSKSESWVGRSQIQSKETKEARQMCMTQRFLGLGSVASTWNLKIKWNFDRMESTNCCSFYKEQFRMSTITNEQFGFSNFKPRFFTSDHFLKLFIAALIITARQEKTLIPIFWAWLNYSTVYQWITMQLDKRNHTMYRYELTFNLC